MIKRWTLSFLLLTPQIFASIEMLAPKLALKLSQMLDMPTNTNPEFYNKLIQETVIPIFKEQLQKYHPDIAEPQYYIDIAKEFHVEQVEPNEAFFIAIPLDFIIHIIKPHINNSPLQKDLFFWEGIAAFHHEITHIKKEHSSKFIAFCDNLQNNRRISIYIDPFALRRNQEREADEGIPNHRLMLLSIQKKYHLLALSKNPCLGNSTHPSDKERAERFEKRLQALLKERNQTINRALKLDKLLKISAPQNMPHAPKLLRIEREHYETILDVIGEHNAA